MNYSDEQLEAIRSPARSMRIIAVAGSGKTTLLDGFARHRSNLRVLYLAFNRAIRAEAEGRFPANVTCMTGHGLAYSALGFAYKSKIGDPRPYHVCSALPHCSMVDAALALQTIQRWLVSDSDEMDERHLPLIGSTLPPAILGLAAQVWSMMADFNHPMPISHDGYFKLFCATNPVLPFDVILFDEFQDASPVTIRLVQQQPCIKVFVGDPHQSIYQFRGAVNALSSVDVEASYPLSVSFRYGQGIADVANHVLSAYGNDPLLIRGHGRHLTNFSVDQSSPHAVLARTNVALFSEAVRLLRGGQSFVFHGGHEGYRLDLFLDAHHLRFGKKALIRSPVIRSFRDYQELVSYSEATDDKELRSLSSVVARYGRDLPSLVEEVIQVSRNSAPKYVVLTTGHRAKGLEFDAVRLLPDFTDMGLVSNPDGSMRPPDSQEINLLYVALTRSCRALELPPALQAWIHRVSPELYAGIAADRSAAGAHASLPPSFWLSKSGSESIQGIKEYFQNPERYPNAQSDILAMVANIIDHLDSGALVLQGPSEPPVIISPSVATAPPRSPAADAKLLALWMSGMSLEEISSSTNLEIDRVQEILLLLLGTTAEDVDAQNLLRLKRSAYSDENRH